MDFIEVVVGVAGGVVGDHLFWLALEAHALTASSAEDLVASVDLHHRHLAVRTLPDSIFYHVFFEVIVRLANLYELLALVSEMEDFLYRRSVTPQRLQY